MTEWTALFRKGAPTPVQTAAAEACDIVLKNTPLHVQQSCYRELFPTIEAMTDALHEFSFASVVATALQTNTRLSFQALKNTPSAGEPRFGKVFRTRLPKLSTGQSTVADIYNEIKCG